MRFKSLAAAMAMLFVVGIAGSVNGQIIPGVQGNEHKSGYVPQASPVAYVTVRPPAEFAEEARRAGVVLTFSTDQLTLPVGTNVLFEIKTLALPLRAEVEKGQKGVPDKVWGWMDQSRIGDRGDGGEVRGVVMNTEFPPKFRNRDTVLNSFPSKLWTEIPSPKAGGIIAYVVHIPAEKRSDFSAGLVVPFARWAAKGIGYLDVPLTIHWVETPPINSLAGWLSYLRGTGVEIPISLQRQVSEYENRLAPVPDTDQQSDPEKERLERENERLQKALGEAKKKPGPEPDNVLPGGTTDAQKQLGAIQLLVRSYEWDAVKKARTDRLLSVPGRVFARVSYSEPGANAKPSIGNTPTLGESVGILNRGANGYEILSTYSEGTGGTNLTYFPTRECWVQVWTAYLGTSGWTAWGKPRTAHMQPDSSDLEVKFEVRVDR